MLNVLGDRVRLCDGLSRRSFLQIGGLALGGLSLPQLLKAEQSSGVSANGKGVIMIFLPGGPSHQDMWDIKTDAPKEIRGEFSPIATSVPGVEICELFPRLAAMANKLTFIRSMVGARDRHDAVQCLTGYPGGTGQPAAGFPSYGSVLSKLYGPRTPGMPAFVGLSPRCGHVQWGDNGQSGFLGPAHAPFSPHSDCKEDMVLNGITLDRLRDRQQTLAAFDRFRSDVDRSGVMEGVDAYTQQALGILTSSKLAEAFDLEKEDKPLRDRYGYGEDTLQDDGSTRLLTNFLLARRLISAGVRCVTLSFSRWDWHNDNFGQGRRDFPMLDQALSALIEDLERRELLDDISIVCWGEFGRTPKINNSAGRDHWAPVSCALLAGGGMKHGQAIGATNRLGEYAVERPVQYGEVFATLYTAVGIDVTQTTLPDLRGRPQYLVDNSTCAPMPELV
jgi:hypothetical protein